MRQKHTCTPFTFSRLRRCFKTDALAVLAFLACFGTASMQQVQGAESALIPMDLRCDYLVNPLGIDDVQPRLSWRLESSQADSRGQSQTAYQILVASRRSLLEQDQADRWDSGRIASDRSLHVSIREDLWLRTTSAGGRSAWCCRTCRQLWSSRTRWALAPASVKSSLMSSSRPRALLISGLSVQTGSAGHVRHTHLPPGGSSQSPRA